MSITTHVVIPAKAGTQTETSDRSARLVFQATRPAWVPAFAGMTALKCALAFRCGVC
jgi:hypothetical protein